jgi:hypothetical protein
MPTAVGTSNFTIHLADTGGQTANKALSITTTVPASLSIQTTSLPNGSVGGVYAQTIAASGGIQQYTWSVSAGSLPAGLQLNATTGTISGKPTTQQTANFTIHVVDFVGVAANKALSILVGPPIFLNTTVEITEITPEDSIFGQSVTLNAEITPQERKVRLHSWMRPRFWASAGWTWGAAELTTISLPAGTHAIRAVYGGDVDLSSCRVRPKR